jgi:S-DNA-T family DNA segregation ATPase FtsK/SpoIIIE
MLFTAALCVALALWPCAHRGDNLIGVFGRVVAGALASSVGWGAWLVPGFLLVAAANHLSVQRRPTRLIAALLSLTFVCTTLHLVFRAGGRLGAAIGGVLLEVIGIGAYVVVGTVILLGFARVTAFSPADYTGRLVLRCRLRVAAAWRSATARELQQHAEARAVLASGASPAIASGSAIHAAPAPDTGTGDNDHSAQTVETVVEEVRVAPQSEEAVIVTRAVESPVPQPAPAAFRETERAAPFRLPRTSLLCAPPPGALEIDERTMKSTALKLEQTLAGFGVLGRVLVTMPGPFVTVYEFEPAAGTKLVKITCLVDDLSRVLERNVRIVAPIPGTSRVGVEVPHDEAHRETVYLRELVEDERWQKLVADLPIAFGKDISGQPIYGDLARMPHLLVAGATGAGKSVGLNAMLASLLMKKTPAELRLLLIDPKVVEMAGFAGIPHLLLPPVTDMKRAAGALQWAVNEVERRFRLLADAGVRNLTAYNARAGTARLPSIVVVVDEFADLMMVAAKDVEASIARLAQKARAAGVHLIVATQRPSVDVITGTIKANFPSRIAYMVVRQEDSKTILGCSGAQHLIGRGDMLCLLPGSQQLQRVHGAYVVDEEIKRLCDFFRDQGAPVYDDTILDACVDDDAGGDGERLYDRAVAFVVAARECSTSAVQRKLSVGYNRAAKLVERMECEGIVGPVARGGGKRQVLVEAR